tara:strand:+ start:21185 stop:21310 length:126 start_codon:yes stop_codon:yes gene_type:complete
MNFKNNLGVLTGFTLQSFVITKGFPLQSLTRSVYRKKNARN